MGGKRDPNNIYRRRVIAFLSREELEFIDRLGMDSQFTTRHKLARAGVISALVTVAMRLGIDGKNVRDKDELAEKILNFCRPQKGEKRRFPRLKKNLIVGFRKLDSMEMYHEAKTGDVSLGGFSVEVAFMGKPFVVNQALEITIKSPDEACEPIKAIGRVAWLNMKDHPHTTELGISITYIKKESRDRYLACISDEAENKNELPQKGA